MRSETSLGSPVGKVVYVTGAGFSRLAGVPLQEGLLPGVVGSKGFSGLDPLPGFLGSVFKTTPTPSLEDVFTLLDESIGRRRYCLGYSHEKLSEIRKVLKEQILHIIDDSLRRTGDNAWSFYRALGGYLLEMRMKAGKGVDPFSVVSLNWDCVLEDALFWCIRKANLLEKADVDYCCYTTPLGKDSPHRPSILQKALGRFNLKVMKLHGSANWLLCPNCDRLYTGIGSTEFDWKRYQFPEACPSCATVWNRSAHSGSGVVDKNSPQLEPFIIAPTFMKAFDNPHINMIWHNAYMDLAEASHVVFIGYSLPEADYHVRTLLRRAVDPEAQITVVLTHADEPKKYIPKYLGRYFAATRYRLFFGGGRVKVRLDGVEGYFRECMGGGSLTDRLRAVAAMGN